MCVYILIAMFKLINVLSTLKMVTIVFRSSIFFGVEVIIRIFVKDL